MKVLLTGGTGYLGSHICAKLIAEGDQVGCLVRYPSHPGRLEKLLSSVTLLPVGNMEEAILRFCPETVINTVCTYSRGTHTEAEILDGNMLFPFRVLQIVRRLDHVRWINTGTSLPPRINSYSFAKAQFGQWGQYYAERGDLQFVDVILEHFYGSDHPPGNFLSWVVSQLQRNEPLPLTAGTQKRDFILVDDVVEIYCLLLHRELDGQYIRLPVGTGESPTIREVVEYLKELTGSRSALEFGAVPMRQDEPDSCCDISRLLALGAKKPAGWREGMKRLV